jgi:GT2 family glycosyltransferase
MKASVVIPAWNGAHFLDDCLNSLRQWTPQAEIVVVDNGSRDNSAEIARRYADQVIVNAHNLGFSGAINQGIAASSGDFVFLLNQDTRACGDWITPIANAFVADTRLGIQGCVLRYPDGEVQHLGGTLSEPDWHGRHVLTPNDSAPLCYMTGAALAIRRETIAQIGLFDEGFFPAYYEDVDYCLRAVAAGWGMALCQRAEFVHYEARGRKQPPAFFANINTQRLRMLAKHRGAAWLREYLAERHAIELLCTPHERDWFSAYSSAYAIAAERIKSFDMLSSTGNAPETRTLLAADLRQIAASLQACANGFTPLAAYAQSCTARGTPQPMFEHPAARARLRQAIEQLRSCPELQPMGGHNPVTRLFDSFFLPQLRTQIAYDTALLMATESDQAPPAPPLMDAPAPRLHALWRQAAIHVEFEIMRPVFFYFDVLNRQLDVLASASAEHLARAAQDALIHVDIVRVTYPESKASRAGFVKTLRNAYTPKSVAARIDRLLTQQQTVYREAVIAMAQWRFTALTARARQSA